MLINHTHPAIQHCSEERRDSPLEVQRLLKMVRLRKGRNGIGSGGAIRVVCIKGLR